MWEGFFSSPNANYTRLQRLYAGPGAKQLAVRSTIQRDNNTLGPAWEAHTVIQLYCYTKNIIIRPSVKHGRWTEQVYIKGTVPQETWALER